MSNQLSIIDQREIENRIFTFRSVQIMIDSDLAELYGVETKVLNQAVKRNIERFPETFRFQLTETEKNELVTFSSRFSYLMPNSKSDSLRSQFVTLNERGRHRKYLPYAFTEQGVAMLSAVLRSETAIKVSILIMNAFVEMRKLVLGYNTLFQRLDRLEIKQIESDNKFEHIFKALENQSLQPENGIFFDGQIFDAYVFMADLIKKARNSIILIDNYIDESVFTILSKRSSNVTAVVYTKSLNAQIQLDLKKHNQQYPEIKVKILGNSHDRFLVIDEKELYHIGSSLKDIGKKWFAFSRMDSFTNEVLNKLK